MLLPGGLDTNPTPNIDLGGAWGAVKDLFSNPGDLANSPFGPDIGPPALPLGAIDPLDLNGPGGLLMTQGGPSGPTPYDGMF
jgi:hypothetical protein